MESVVIVVRVLAQFVPQMFCPFLDTTLPATRGALRTLVPAMFGAFVPLMRETLGAFPVVVRIVHVIVGVHVLPPCKVGRWVDVIPLMRHNILR